MIAMVSKKWIIFSIQSLEANRTIVMIVHQMRFQSGLEMIAMITNGKKVFYSALDVSRANRTSFAL